MSIKRWLATIGFELYCVSFGIAFVSFIIFATQYEVVRVASATIEAQGRKDGSWRDEIYESSTVAEESSPKPSIPVRKASEVVVATVAAAAANSRDVIAKVKKEVAPPMPSASLNNSRIAAAITTRPAKKAQPRAHRLSHAQMDQLVNQESERHGIDPLLVRAIIKQESNGNIRAMSRKGAAGVMQLMPQTANRFGVRNRFNPKQSVRAGVKYLAWLMNRFDGDVKLALAGYNAGERAVDNHGRRIPPYRETRNYVRRITNHYEQLQKRRATEQPRLPEVPKSDPVGFTPPDEPSSER